MTIAPSASTGKSRRLRIAFFVTNFPKLSEVFILNQALALIERGHEIDIFALTSPVESHVQPGTERLAGRVHAAGMPRGPFKRLAALPGLLSRNRFGEILKSLDPLREGAEAISLRHLFRLDSVRTQKLDYDIVHAQLGSVARQCALLRRLGYFDAPLVSSFRGSDLSRYLAHGMPGAYREVFSISSFIMPVAARWVDPLASLGCPRDKIRHLPSGIPMARIPLREERAWGGSDFPRIVSACRLERYKGIHHGLEAFRIVRERYPTAVYEIFGDGPERQKLMAQAQRLGISSNVRWHGAVHHDEILRTLPKCDLHWFTTITRFDGRTEGVPNILKETQATGLPAVAFDHPGVDEVLLPDETGLVVPEGDAAGLADASLRLLADPDLARRMGALATGRAREIYDLEHLTDRLEAIYHAAAGQRAI